MGKVIFSENVYNQVGLIVFQMYTEGYFTDVEYAKKYMRKVLSFFKDNITTLATWYAPNLGKSLQIPNHYVMYRKNSKTTWYAFFRQEDETYIIEYIANNHAIGHLIEN